MLDESTAELAKMEWAPVLATIEATFKIKKAVPLHTTVRIDCKVGHPLPTNSAQSAKREPIILLLLRDADHHVETL